VKQQKCNFQDLFFNITVLTTQAGVRIQYTVTRKSVTNVYMAHTFLIGPSFSNMLSRIKGLRDE
jgi:hypothetical protein